MNKVEFKTLFDNHFDAIRNYIWYRCGDAALASDIAQDAFLKIWEKQLENNNGNLKSLLFKIAGDLFVNNYRRKNVQLKFQINNSFENKNESPEDQFEYNELKLQYEKALSALPEKQRTVYLMHRIDNMKYSEIAFDLGISVKAIEKRMSKALGFLKKKLKYSETR